MQSFVQYRRFERRLREQIEKHGEAIASGISKESEGHAEAQEKPRSPSPLSPPARTEIYDRALEEKDLQNDGPLDSLREYTRQTPHELQVSKDGEDLSGTTTRSSTFSLRAQVRQDGLSAVTTSNNDDDGARLGHALTGVNVRSRLTHEGRHDPTKQRQVFIVDFQGDDDPMNPHNWPIWQRMGITSIVALIGLIVGFASSVDSAALKQAMQEFGVSEVVEALATGLYLVGFGFGAFFAAPMSETVGRNPVYIVTMVLFMVFVMASGLAPNIGAQLVFRLLAGFFGSTPLTCAGGSISDMWTAQQRTAVFPLFANAAFWGPVLGPAVGGFIGQASSHGIISWRWVEWTTLIWSGLILAIMVVFMPETFPNTLLHWKAAHLRKLTGDDRYVSPLEVQDTRFFDRMIQNLYRPFLLIAFEPIVDLFTLYLTIVYIVLFTFLTGFEFIFTETFGLGQGLTFLCFLGIGVGFFGATALVPWLYKKHVKELEETKKRGGTRLPPEHRLIFAMLGAPFLPIGLFWMAWTAYPSISVWSCIASTVPIGFSIMSLFISTYSFLIDLYEIHAASALVGITFVRYVVAGAFVEISLPMYNGIGVHWSLSVLGAISLVMAPVPFIFFKFGNRIRKRSRYAADFSTGT